MKDVNRWWDEIKEDCPGHPEGRKDWCKVINSKCRKEDCISRHFIKAVEDKK